MAWGLLFLQRTIINLTLGRGMEKSAIIQLEDQRKQLLRNPPDTMEQAFLYRHAGMFDEYFQEYLQRDGGIGKNKFSVVALGGYGRREQCLHSDIDVMIVFKDTIPGEAENIVRNMIYPLWDLKFEVGYATRTIKDCVYLSLSDFQILTSLLDARLITGDESLFRSMQGKVYQKVILKKKKQYITWLSENSRQRHEAFGDSAYLLEPNLKEGMGGLRDYHTMIWMSKAAYSEVYYSSDTRQNHLPISESDFQELNRSLSFIWEVRNRLHQLAGKKCDRLYLEFHEGLANHFKIQQNDDLHIIERFLGMFHEQVEVVKHQYSLLQAELTGGFTSGLLHRIFGKQTRVQGLTVRNRMLDFESREACIENPFLLIEIFLESLRQQLPVSGEAKRMEAELLYLLGDSFRSSTKVKSALEKILMSSHRRNKILDDMLYGGVLVALIPQFKGVVNRIEYDEYHSFPVDKHSLLTLKTVNELGQGDEERGEGLYQDLFQEIKDPTLLRWAALLHDIGKLSPHQDHSTVGASIGAKVLRQLGYNEKEIDTVSFLIQHHLLLKKTATQRDLNDEQTAISCAAEIKDVERLKTLYLLTVADCRATGSKAWTSWTATLIRDLFFRVLRVLEKGELATEQSQQIIEGKLTSIRDALGHESLPPDMSFLQNTLSPRYLLSISENDIIDHLALFKKLGDKPFVWRVDKHNGAETRTVTICARNRPGLFSRITGVFSVHNVNVLDAQAFTWRNNVALDIFQVTAPKDELFEERTWKKAEQDLEKALAGSLDIGEAIQNKFSGRRQASAIPIQKQAVVNIDNQTSSFFTIVEVYAYDFPGLLFRIADTIFAFGFDIQVCKAATSIDQAADIFYIRDVDGEKSESEETLRQLKQAIEEIVNEDH